jgi:Na+/pantothenate symporter
MIPPHKQDIANFASVTSMGLKDGTALFLIGIFYPLANGDTWQHIFSAKNNKVIRTAFPTGGIVLMLMTISLIFLGYGIKTHLPDADPKMALFDFYRAELVSPIILVYIAIVVMAITTSDLDSQTYLFTSTSIKNIAPPSIAQNKHSYKRWARFVIIGALTFTTLVALTISNIVQFLFQMVSLMYILAPVFLFSAVGWLKRSTLIDRLVTATVIFSAGIYVWLFAGHMLDDNLILTCVPAGISVFGCSLIALTHHLKGGRHAKSNAR